MKLRQVSTGNFEGVVGLRKEVVEAQPAQYDLYHGGSVARVPGGNGDGKGEDRYFHARWLWASGPVPETEAVRALTG